MFSKFRIWLDKDEDGMTGRDVLIWCGGYLVFWALFIGAILLTKK